MKITRHPVDPGPAGWARLLPDPPEPAPLDGAATADFLIIGAGFAGLAAARRLVQLNPHARVVVLDAVRVGDGPAGRNSGFMIDLPHDLASTDYGGTLDSDTAQIADNRRAIAFAGDMVDAYDMPAQVFDRCGKINGAATAKGARHNLDYAAHLAKLGEAHTMLDAAQMHEITGIEYYRGGLFTPGTVMLQPAAFVRGVAAGLRKSNRVTLHENSPVIALERQTDWVAQTPNGQITAPYVILAVNGHLQDFGHMQRHLIHTHTYASMTRPLTSNEAARLGGRRTWNLTPADPLGTTVRRISDVDGDRIVVRNRFTYDPKLVPPKDWLNQITRDHDRAFAARFPMLRSVDMQYRWGGRLCLSMNNVQVVKELEIGLFSACCQNGLGTAKGTLAGMLAAEMASGVTSAALQRALSTPPPRQLPPAPIAKLGGDIRLRWGEFQAGAEK